VPSAEAGADSSLVAVAAAAAPSLDASAVLYDLLLLHGEAVRLAEHLPAGLNEGDSVSVAGEEWTVAAVREGGHRPELVCIRDL
jgi:hypothetical protein